MIFSDLFSYLKKTLCTYIHTKFPHRIKKDIPCTSAENVSADAYVLNAVPRIKGLLFHSRHLKKKKTVFL